MRSIGNMMLVIATLFLTTFTATQGVIEQMHGLNIDVGSTPYWVYLTWTRQTDPAVIQYEINYWETPQTLPQKEIIVPANQQSYNITDIMSGSTFNLHIRAASSTEKGQWSTLATFVTNGPKPPLAVNIEDIRDVQARVQWTPNDKDIPDRYYLYVTENVGPNPMPTRYPSVPKELTYILVENLKPATPYTVRVTAVKNGVESSFTTNGFRTGLRSMEPPAGLRMTEITPVSAVLNWNRLIAMENVTHFEIEAADNNNTAILSTTNDPTLQFFRIQNLAPASSYFLRIRTSLLLQNGIVVKGRWSDKIGFTTVALMTIAEPTGLDLQPANDRVEMKWSAVSTAAGQQIVSYTIEYTIGFVTGNTVETNTANLYYTLSGLQSGTTYSLRMAAKDNFGNVGRFTTWAAVETTGPKPVTSISITEIKALSARITWTVHSESNYDQVRMRVKDNSNNQYLPDVTFTKLAGVSSHVITGLAETTPYSIFMTTEIQGQTSSVATHGFRTDSSSASIVPRNVATQLGSPIGTVVVSCDRINNVNEYQVRAQIRETGESSLQRFDATTSSRQEMSVKLKTGYEYNIEVRAKATNYYGAYSSPVTTITTPGGRAPVSLSIYDVTDKNVKITWISAYPSTQSVMYVVTLRAQGNVVEQKEVAHDAIPITFNQGLLSNTEYSFEVASKSPINAQVGELISQTFMTPKGTPNQPFFTTVSTSTHTATFTWQLIPNRDDILYYEIQLTENYLGSNPTEKTYKTGSGQQNSYVFNDLTSRILYAVRVRGIARESTEFNAKGYYSILKIFSVLGNLPGPSLKMATPDGTSILVSWDTGNTQGILHYELEITTINSDVTTFARTPSVTSMYEITDLHPNTNYRIRVRAIAVEGGEGEWSAVMMAKTGASTTGNSKDDSGMGSGVVAGIVVAVILLIIIALVAIFMLRKRINNRKFDRFENGSVKFSKGGHSNGSLTHEMEERQATAIKPGNNGALYT